MEARYEIREKIGQGGMGSVYRAYDTRMARDVAIKRIPQEGDPSEQEAASQQIAKEAGALALLQHPHIVTVYDVGTDEEGPYVVMELISGKTLDELIERAPLTWQDFRELALQTQEALIAAQELNLVHRDIKSSNLMLTWLPSGKFQVKIVDFGLARFAHSSALDHLEDADAEFGSIFFMCPEQFERATLDARADMYSMGCVYYHALAGIYPFNGSTGMQVMTAHLEHQVKPLQDVRPDLPRWVCDWVMWHINRQPADRPESARESLKVFLQNANIRSQSMSEKSVRPALGKPQAPHPASISAPQATGAGLAVPEPPRTQTAPQPLLPPEGSKPSVHASPPPPPPPPMPAPPVVLPPAVVAAPPAAQQPAVPAARMASSAKPASANLPKSTAVPKAAIGPRVINPVAPGHAAPASATVFRPPGEVHPETALHVPHKRPLSKEAKIAIKTISGILVAIVIFFLVGKIPSPRDSALKAMIQTALVEEASNAPEADKNVPVTRETLDILLDATLKPTLTKTPAKVYTALVYAKSTDDTDVDANIVNFVIKQFTNDHCDLQLLEVLRKRKIPAVVTPLLEFCRTTGNAKAAAAAIETCSTIATENDFPKFVEIIDFTGNATIRQAAEDSAAAILRKSVNRGLLGGKVVASLSTASSADARYSLIRLLGSTGNIKAAEIITKSLAAEDKKEQLAAALALAAWPDDAKFETLLGYLATVKDDATRKIVFDACVRFVANPERQRPPEVGVNQWKLLAEAAKSPAEKEQVERARSGPKPKK